MRKNFTQAGTKSADMRTYIEGDWYHRGIPANVITGPNVYIDTSYGFAAFNSLQPGAMFIGEASGCYDRASFIAAENAKIQVGKYCILNGTTIICNDHISIGDHCMVSWGSVITDTWLPVMFSIDDRKALLMKTGNNPLRHYPFCNESKPVILEDNCWVGFGAVIMPGVRLGKGCIVGCKTIVTKDVPPYAVVTGSDEKIVRFLQPVGDETLHKQG